MYSHHRFSAWALTLLVLVSVSVVEGSSTAVAAPDTTAYSNYLEFRVYPMQDGQRDNMLRYFENHYLESQEAFNMRIWGQFRDLEVDTNFVWMRGYRAMEERKKGLYGFYTSDIWRETSPQLGEMFAANPTHIHFLEPVSPGAGLDDAFERSGAVRDPGVVVAQMFRAEKGYAPVVRRLREQLIPAFEKRGAVALGLFRSSDEPNNVPQLPFIENEPVVVWLASFATRDAFEKARSAVAFQPGPFETFVLEPGLRSRLRHRGASTSGSKI